MSLNYFKKILMSGLNVKEKTTLEEELNPLETAVQYTPQELTEEQLIQVRKNLGLHYSGVPTVNIEWDKDTTGRAAITTGSFTLYKVSDTVFSADALVGTILTFDNGNKRKVDAGSIKTLPGGFTADQAAAWISANAGEYPEVSLTIEESGTYLQLTPSYQPCILSMSNEININWDGDETGKPQVRDRYDNPMAFYKVSSEMPPSDWLVGVNYSLSNIPDTSDTSFKIYAEQIEQLDYNAYRINYRMSDPFIGSDTVIIVGTAGKHENSDGTSGINLPEDGMYFFKNSYHNTFVSNLSYHTNAVHKIEQQYIPDTIATKLYVDQQIREAIREAYNT